MAVLRTRIEFWQVAFQHTHLCTGTHAPLLVDDATLLLNLLWLQQQSVSPVVQNEQAAIDNSLTGSGHVRDVIYRTVNAGISIQVTTELDSDGLTPFDDVVAFEVLGAVEAHVLQEVCQTALVVVLLNSADTLGNIELSTLLGPGVVTNVVCQTVVQLTNTDFRVCRNGLLRHHGCRTHQRQGSHHQFLQFHSCFI